MAVRVRVPTPLRRLTKGQAEVSVQAATVALAIDALEADFPGMAERLRDEQGELRRFVNLFLNGEDIRFLSGLESPLNDGDELSIVPAMAGG
jgi:molybdopterin synthase sulfur carrier subunit